MKTLVLFDFDHTLYDGDSLIDFTRNVAGKRFYPGMVSLLPWLVGLKLGLLHNQKVKERFLTHFFKGMEMKEFESLGKQFSFSLSDRLDRDLKMKLFGHLQQKHEVAIVTASLPQWIDDWAQLRDIKVIGSRPEAVDGRMTGKLLGKNCYGPEKVARITAVYNLDAFDHIIVYGAGKGDRDMLRLAR